MNAFIELRIISDELRLSPFDEIPYMSDDIPALAIGAIGKINQTNPGVVRGIDSMPATNLDPGKRDLRLTDRR
ncbi:MAG: hypothetical protein EHM38_09045 [Geobacteraceae bacterium]|nr:MAG: hypothetical protein EHM38_09045 [Geobacteraceae bacterium]